jgi:hypothetical protein
MHAEDIGPLWPLGGPLLATAQLPLAQRLDNGHPRDNSSHRLVLFSIALLAHGRGTGPGTAAHWEAQPPVVAHGAAAALRTRPLPQPTASSLVVESCFLAPQDGRMRSTGHLSWRKEMLSENDWHIVSRKAPHRRD